MITHINPSAKIPIETLVILLLLFHMIRKFLAMSNPDGYVRLTKETFNLLLESNGGVCLECKEIVYDIDPEVEGCSCPSCGAKEVYGVAQASTMGKIELVK